MGQVKAKGGRGGSRPKVRPDDKRGGLHISTRPDAKRPGRKAQHYTLVLPIEIKPLVQLLALVRSVEGGVTMTEEKLVEALILEARERQLEGKDDD